MGVMIEKIGGSVKRISPIDQRKTSLKQNGAHNIIKCAKSMLGVTILLRGVRAPYTKDYTVDKEEREGRGVIELVTVVTLNCLDRGAELCAHI